MMSSGSAFVKPYLMSLGAPAPPQTLTAEGLQGLMSNFPSSKGLFLSCFGDGKFDFATRGTDGTGRQNVKFQATRAELDPVFGVGWGTRSFDTTTVCEVDPSKHIGVKWYYQSRVNFDHSACPRCTWQGNNMERPSLCSAREEMIPGPPGWSSVSPGRDLTDCR